MPQSTRKQLISTINFSVSSSRLSSGNDDDLRSCLRVLLLLLDSSKAVLLFSTLDTCRRGGGGSAGSGGGTDRRRFFFFRVGRAGSGGGTDDCLFSSLARGRGSQTLFFFRWGEGSSSVCDDKKWVSFVKKFPLKQISLLAKQNNQTIQLNAITTPFWFVPLLWQWWVALLLPAAN